MSKCADSLEHWNTQSVATRVVETVVAGLLILMMAACNVGPNYKRPATSTPQSFRGALAPEVAAPAQAETSIGDQKWSTIFQDPILQRLVADLQARAIRGELARSEATIGTVVEEALALYAEKHGGTVGRSPQSSTKKKP